VPAVALPGPTLSGFRRAAERILPLFIVGFLPRVLVVLVAVGTLSSPHYLWDFRVFWHAGRDVLAGHSPYPAPDPSRLAGENTFVYPPEAALAFVPLALLPYHAAGAVFLAILFASIPLTLWLLGVRDWRCYGAAFLMAPVFSAIVNGALSCLLALMLAVAWRYRSSRTGAAAAVAVLIVAKVFLWPLLLWLLATRRYAAAVAAAAGGALATFAAWAVLGFAGLRDYFHLLRLLADVEQAQGFSPIALGLSIGESSGWARAGTLLLGAAALAGIFVLARRHGGDRLSFTAAVGAALVLSPIVWLHYFVILLVPLAISRPRFTRLWVLLPLPFWFAGNSGQSGGHTASILLALAAAAAMLVLPAGRPPLPSLRPAPSAASVTD